METYHYEAMDDSRSNTLSNEEIKRRCGVVDITGR